MPSDHTAPATNPTTSPEEQCQKNGNNKTARKQKIGRTLIAFVLFFVFAIALYYIYMVVFHSAYIPNAIIGVISADKGPACHFIFPFSGISFIIGFAVCLIWAIYLYVGLRQEVESDGVTTAKKNRAYDRPVWEVVQKKSRTKPNQRNPDPSNTNNDDPLSFHQLAQTHKDWSQLWFTISITIFLGGVIFAVFNLGVFLCIDQSLNKISTNWSIAILKLAPNVFVYTLFFIAWRWSARHFRAHWHNFISNAYRHRALWRYEEIQRKLIELSADVGFDATKPTSSDPYMRDISSKIREQAAATILELYRQSGVLLLLPGDSSYLESGQDERTGEQIVRIEEIIRSSLTKGP